MSESSPTPGERGRRYRDLRQVEQARQDVKAGLFLLAVYFIDAALLAGFWLFERVDGWVPAAYVLVGIVVVGGFALAAARAGKAGLKETNAVLVQTLVALLLTLSVAWLNHGVCVLMLLTVVVIIPTAALRLSPGRLVVLSLLAALGILTLLHRCSGQLLMPVATVGERTLTALFILWTLIKGASVNLAGMAMRLALDDSHAKLVNALERVEVLAERDELTGLPNRRRILDVLARVRHGQTTRGLRYSVAMLDIDHFKLINDTFGHATGDEVLRIIGKLLNCATGASDVAGRLGGEEFLLVLQESPTLTDAEVVAERLRRAVERYDWSTLQTELRVTASIGLAVAEADEPVDIVLRRADQGLYEAKRSGRNRTRHIVPHDAGRSETRPSRPLKQGYQR